MYVTLACGQVDATKNKDLATRFEVTGFPSIKFFPRGDGEIEHYEGGRDLKSMVKYINEKVSLQSVWNDVDVLPTATCWALF